MQTDFFRNEIRSRVGHAVNQVSINQKNLAKVPMVIPPIPEQNEIVHRVESLFKVAAQIQKRYEIARNHVGNLSRSVLAKAFRGELVPQNPKDEPAEVLLQRIKDTWKEVTSSGTTRKPHASTKRKAKRK